MQKLDLVKIVNPVEAYPYVTTEDVMEVIGILEDLPDLLYPIVCFHKETGREVWFAQSELKKIHERESTKF